jgi:DNA-binding response OmpR family regulator
LTRIVVVDDEPDITAIIKRALEQNGFAVDAFNKPDEALAHFKPDYYAMLITDIRMPTMNGFELYRHIKKRDQKIKVAFMTAFEVYEDEFKRVLPSIDVKCFFKKPVRMNELVERVKHELGEEFTLS